MADRLGQVRDPMAVLAHRDRDRRAAAGAARGGPGRIRDLAEIPGRGHEGVVPRGARRAAGEGGRMSVSLSVVVPVCNEAENVEPLAREIHAALAALPYE